ncbi:hypothetical protein ACGFS9_21230 [Streptomyces sp. NPDC048566]|uniref:hypothetical protein n=1 Tax=Streptomyces sp. NPDC048566 TaxID=3365569 RepID=UPI0037198E51
MAQITATTSKTAIPPVSALGTNGHETYLVRAAEDDKQAAYASADRYIAREHPEVAAFLTADRARERTEALLATPHVTLVHDYGLGAWRTTPIETDTREITDGPTEDIPWLAAEIVVTDFRSQAHGRHTRLWLHNNRHTAQLTVDQARARLAEARGFLDQFEALLDHAETVAAGDFEGDPEIAAADREAEDRRIKAIGEARLALAAGLLAEARG